EGEDHEVHVFDHRERRLVVLRRIDVLHARDRWRDRAHRPQHAQASRLTRIDYWLRSIGDESSASRSSVVRPAFSSVKNFCSFAARALPAASTSSIFPSGMTVTPSTSPTIQSPRLTSTSPTRVRPPTWPGFSLVAPRSAIIDENTGKLCASSASTSRTPPSI